MKTHPELPPDLALRDVVTTQEPLLELPPEPPLDPPPSDQQQKPRPPEPFLRRG